MVSPGGLNRDIPKAQLDELAAFVPQMRNRYKVGVIERYKVRTASFCNWLTIEHAVQGNIVPDFPVINKSLNLSYAGTDL